MSSQDTSSYVSFKKPKQFLCPLCNSDGSEDNQEIHLKVLLISNFCLFKLRTFSTVCELKKGASFASELDDQHLFVNIHENAPHSSHKERNNVILGQHELEMEESPVFLFKIYRSMEISLNKIQFRPTDKCHPSQLYVYAEEL